MNDSEAAFSRILQRAKALERFNRRVLALLDEQMARHCQVANLRDGTIIFTCTSPGCATRLRLQSAELLERLHGAGLEEIETIVVKLIPPG